MSTGTQRRNRRDSPRAREILDAGRQLLDKEGVNALSMRRVAELVGIRAASIYKHFRNKEALEAALISDGMIEFAESWEGVEEPDALARFAAAYRAFALRSPNLYRLMTERPLPRERLASGSEERAAQPALDAADQDPDLARAIWAFAHGMIILELNGRFPPSADLNAAWRRGLDGLRRTAHT